ncbi:MAG: HNH endonuclease [Gammaproteobacteria bacterium]|nr:HNH endonuclease [Gammaproteobacteria bacterium]
MKRIERFLLKLIIKLLKLPFRFILFIVRKYIVGKRLTADGYVMIRSESGIDQYEHRIVAERILRRPLAPREVVHHINGRRNDNRASNLCVMDYEDHDRYHRWYDWVVEKYGRHPRRSTQLKKLKETFKGTLL